MSYHMIPGCELQEIAHLHMFTGVKLWEKAHFSSSTHVYRGEIRETAYSNIPAGEL